MVWILSRSGFSKQRNFSEELYHHLQCLGPEICLRILLQRVLDSIWVAAGPSSWKSASQIGRRRHPFNRKAASGFQGSGWAPHCPGVRPSDGHFLEFVPLRAERPGLYEEGSQHHGVIWRHSGVTAETQKPHRETANHLWGTIPQELTIVTIPAEGSVKLIFGMYLIWGFWGLSDLPSYTWALRLWL